MMVNRMGLPQSRNCVNCNTHPLHCGVCGMEQPDDEPEWEARAEQYRAAFLREEVRADALGRQVDDLRAALEAYFSHLRKSVNVGPLTKNPTKEAALLRRLMDLISAPNMPPDLSDGLPHLNRNE